MIYSTLPRKQSEDVMLLEPDEFLQKEWTHESTDPSVDFDKTNRI